MNISIFISQYFLIMNPFSVFDRIVCITLSEATREHERVSKLAMELGMNMEFHVVERNKRGGKRGCFESHIQVMEMCIESGARNVLIFEDDFIPTPTFSWEAMQEVADFISSNDSWEAISLGCNVFNDKNGEDITFGAFYESFTSFINAPKATRHIIKFYGMMSHAYVVSLKGMERAVHAGRKLLSMPDDDIIDIDKLLVYLFRNGEGYCYTPMIFDQILCKESTTFNAARNKELWFAMLRRSQCLFEKIKFFYILSQAHYHPIKVCCFIAFLLLLPLVLVALFIWLCYKVFVFYS